MKIQEALKLLNNSGYVCEATVVAAPTFEDYKKEVYQLLSNRLGQERADVIIDYEEREL